jgi:DNA polymerase-1
VSLLDKRDTEGRIHSTYSLFGTTTGRLASKKPNLQNIPRDKTIKSLFGAPPGRLILECDYKSAELRALAMYSQDPFLIRVFQNNFDMHDETAAAMFGKDFTSEQRMQAKMINFGIMYGRGPKTIAESCKITIQEAQNSINKWLQRMPAAAAYLKSRRNAVRSGCVLTTPFGRKRRFPFVTKQMLNTYQNEACNFAIQSIASDFTLITGIRIQKQLREFDAYIVNLVHDSLVVELPADYDTAVHLFNWVPQQMSETPARWFKLPFAFAADASIGTHWGRLYETVDEAFGR